MVILAFRSIRHPGRFQDRVRPVAQGEELIVQIA
jgi:hypothetical protein